MARFSAHRLSDGSWVLDCQADLLDHLTTRFVVPLIPIADVGTTYYDYRIQRYVERPRSGAGLSRVVYNNGAMSIILRMVD